MPQIKVTTAIFACLFLTACSSVQFIEETFKSIEDELSLMHGQHINELVEKIGYPTNDLVVAGRKLYIWDKSRIVSTPSPQTALAHGTVHYPSGNVGHYSGSTTLFGTKSDSHDCNITVEVDEKEIIVNHQTEGNFGGCHKYCLRLTEEAEKEKRCPLPWWKK